MYYQFDGGLVNFTTEVRQFLDKKFPGKWIGHGGLVNWSPQDPQTSLPRIMVYDNEK